VEHFSKIVITLIVPRGTLWKNNILKLERKVENGFFKV